MQVGEERELSIGEFFELAEKEGGIYEIETPEGWVEVGSLVKKPSKNCYRVQLGSGRELKGSGDHLILTPEGWTPLKDALIGSFARTKDGEERIESLEPMGVRDTLDLEVKSPNQWYYSNGVVSHNTGKTALARAFAEDLDMPIWVYDLTEMSNFNFMKYWTAMLSAAPCIALIEDFDNVFHGRQNVSRKSFGSEWDLYREEMRDRDDDTPDDKKKKKHGPSSGLYGALTFDCFLNALDGVERNDGIFTIITTNHVKHIDEALGKPQKNENGELEFVSTRPGRIDKAIELTYMAHEDKVRMAHKLVGEYPDALADVLRYLEVHRDKNETPAQFQERCSQVALACFWKKYKSPQLHVYEEEDLERLART